MLPAKDVQLGSFIGLTPLAGVACLSAALGAQAYAQFGGGPGGSDPFAEDTPHASMRLAIGTESLTPGEHELAVVFSIDEDWHLYWKNPGETGLAPSFEFTLPDGVERAGEVRWPAPERYVHGGGRILDYIYEDEFALLVPVRVSEELLGSSVELRVDGFWLVCKEACIPGEGFATLSTSVGRDAGKASGDAGVIAASRERTPGDELSAIGATAGWDGLSLTIDAPGAERVRFFPIAPDIGGPADPIRDGATEGESLRVAFDERVVRAERIEGMVGVTRDGQERFVEFTMPAPRPAE